MAILLDPNIAYLLLVVGFLLTVFALITPGTGFFEAGAVIVLGVAAWLIFMLDINVWALVLLVLAIVPFVFAIRNKQRTLNLALTLFAFVFGSAFMFRSEVWWQPAVNPILAIFVSITAGGFFWLTTRKVLEASHSRPSHDLSDLVGSEGETRSPIDLEGSIYLKGELWTAISDAPIDEGQKVKVIGREGFILHVEQIEK